MAIDFGNMSVPGATSDLMATLAGETDEARRKRLLQQQQQKLLPNAGAGLSSLGSPTGYGVVGSFR